MTNSSAAGMTLCVDAMPTENGHRARGIGTVAREIVRALDAVNPSSWRSIRYLSRHVMPGIRNLTWAPRSAAADWTGVDDRLPSLASAAWQALETATSLPRDTRRAGCDVFLATDPWGIARSSAFKTVAIVYDFIPLLFPEEYLHGAKRAPRRALYRLSLGRLLGADRLVAISEATRQDAIRLLNVPADRIDVAHLAVDREVFRPRGEEGRALVDTRFGLPGPYFLYVGELDARKNIDAILEAFGRLAHVNTVVKLVLVGVGERSRRLLNDRTLRRASFADRVIFPGHVSAEELAALYSAATALVFLSRYEGFGLPVLEGMSCGVPVMTSPVSSLPEVAGDAAVYVDPTDAEAVFTAMKDLLGDPGLREHLATRGTSRAAQFSWRRTALQILASCERAARSPAR